MGGFSEMMNRLQRGVIDPEIENGYERAGSINPTFLLHSARTPETFSQTLLEVVGPVLQGLEGYVERRLESSPSIRPQAELFLGQPRPYGHGVMEPCDLILVCVNWRLEVVGSRMALMAWHCIKSAIHNSPSGRPCIVWPPLNDTVTKFWPLRVLKEAHNYAALSLHLRAQTLKP